MSVCYCYGSHLMAKKLKDFKSIVIRDLFTLEKMKKKGSRARLTWIGSVVFLIIDKGSYSIYVFSDK